MASTSLIGGGTRQSDRVLNNEPEYEQLQGLPQLPRTPLRRSSHKRNSANIAVKLSEKGSEQGFEGGFGRYEEAEMGRKEPSQCSLGSRHGRLRGFSDSFMKLSEKGLN